MALDMTPEQKEIGKANFYRTVGGLAQGPSRRDFMQGLVAAAAAVPLSAAAYFGYTAASNWKEKPVKVGFIGTGDEGLVLIGQHNPAFLEIVAISDIRPSNYNDRVWKGEGGPTHPRYKGLNLHYGNDAKNKIPRFTDYREMLQRSDIEAVVIALPLHLHYQATMDALEAGKHVLCEKLMAWNITQCKAMIRKAREKDLVLAIGHQRHYSMLYSHAVEVLKSGVLGDIRHIRALWHRNNATPLMQGSNVVTDRNGQIQYRDSWRPAIKKEDEDFFRGKESDLKKFGYRDLNELVRWRLFQRTGGGLMAELGSHQLDACSIFLGKKRPIAVTAVGGKHFYTDDREVEDHVYCLYEFPGQNYDPKKPVRSPDGKSLHNDIVTVSYSSISTNAFEPYGECVMGSKGTLVVEQEQAAYLWGSSGRGTAVSVAAGGGGGRPALDSSASTPGGSEADKKAETTGQTSLGSGPISRGYTEEMDYFAYIIRQREQANSADRANLKPRCDGQRAMEDAIVALTANQAMWKQTRIVFKEEWFNPDLPDVPDADMKPDQA